MTDPSATPSTLRARRYGGPNGYGHQPDPDGHRYSSAHHVIGLPGAKAVPASHSMRAKVLAGPGILNQKQSGSCVGHALDGAIETDLLISTGKRCDPRAPMCVYDVARAIDRVPNADGTFPALTDEGCQPNQALRGVQEWGICALAVRPYADDTINAEPKLAELTGASVFLLKGASAIYATGQDRLTMLKQAISQDRPVCFAVQVNEAFEEYSGTLSPHLTPSTPAESLGGHYIYLVGYRTLPDGSTLWEFANSWDIDWGDGGFGWATDAFMLAATNLIICTVTPTSALAA